MSKAIANYIAQWAKFNTQGRASRSEYWNAFLGYFLIAIVYTVAINIVISVAGAIGIDMSFLSRISSLVISAGSLPFIPLGIRRLHDIGITGWLYLISLTVVGNIALIVMFCMDSQAGVNKYGANPKGM